MESQESVNIALDRMQDAENCAAWIDAQNEMLKQQVQRSRRPALGGFVFGGVSFGIGTPLIVGGIKQDNKTMLITGTGVVVGTGLVWAAGHYLFGWW